MIYFKTLILIFLVFSSCSGLQKRPFAKPTKKEIITRSNEYRFELDPPKIQHLETYHWEKSKNEDLSKITKDFFRCKGSFLNPSKYSQNEEIQDCDSKHTLPLFNKKEAIYPVLLDLLNYIQNKTHKKVIITSGHRCPIHNKYVDDSQDNKFSKHMIGAEVDFYVDGFEKRPQEIINLIFSFYRETPGYRGKIDFEQFFRYDDSKKKIATYPWFNKEILITLYGEGEGRNLDNRHSYSYISIQVLYDRQLKKNVVFSQEKAIKGYMRF